MQISIFYILVNAVNITKNENNLQSFNSSTVLLDTSDRKIDFTIEEAEPDNSYKITATENPVDNNQNLYCHYEKSDYETSEANEKLCTNSIEQFQPLFSNVEELQDNYQNFFYQQVNHLTVKIRC